MNGEQCAKLARLQGLSTRYEAIVRRADGATRLLCYSARHSGHGLRAALQQRAAEVLAFIGGDETTRATVRRHKAGPQSIELTGGHVVAWSCRTQRDAIILGELPYVGAAVLP